MKKYSYFIKTLCWLLLLLPALSSRAANIVQLKYYVDADSTNVYTHDLQPAVSVDTSITLLPAGLPSGFHTLTLWTVADNGMRSLNQYSTFYYSNATSPNNKIAQIEFTIDDTTVQTIDITPAYQVNQVFELNTAGLQPGLHKVKVVSIADDGKRSLENFAYFNLHSGSGIANKISALEFVIDNDTANKQVRTVTPAQAINADFTVDLSSVEQGLHQLSVTAVGDNGLRSHTSYGTFLKTNGQAQDSIVALEYFFDVDPGAGNGTRLTITPQQSIDTAITLIVPEDLSLGYHRLAVRALSNAGEWGLFQWDSLRICDVLPPQAGFETVRFGNTINFIDTSKYGAFWKYDFGDGQTDSVPSPLHAYGAFDRYQVVQVVGNACLVDTVRSFLDIAGIEQYSPAFAGQGLAVIDFHGAGFTSLTEVVLKKGGTTITPDTIALSEDGKQMRCIFDFTGSQTGRYDVEVSGITNLETQIYPEGFEIQSESDDPFSVNIVGPAVVRNNLTYDYKIEIHNNSNVVSRLLPVFIAVSDNTELTFLDSISNRYFDGGLVSDSLLPYGVVTPEDSFSFTGKIYVLYISAIANGDKYVLNVRYKSSATGNNKFRVKVFSGMDYDSSFNARISIDCWKAIASVALTTVDASLDAIPVVDCIWSAAKAAATSGWLGSTLGNLSNMFGSWGKSLFGNTGNVTQAWAETMKNCAPELIALTGVGAPLAAWLEANDAVVDAFNGSGNVLASTIEAFDECNNDDEDEEQEIDSRASLDPNAKYGPSGFQGYINEEKTMAYTIHFENMDTATAAAQIVFIADTLDSEVYDLSTFEFDHIQIAGSWYKIPPHRQEFVVDYDLPGDQNNILRISAKLDTAEQVAKWWLITFDKLTRKVTLDALAGFLAPNVQHPEGHGWVSYKIMLKDGLPHDTEIKNRAVIVFDNNEPILTDHWVNTIDKEGPVSNVASAARTGDSTVVLTINANDAHSGVKRYAVYMSKDGGAYNILGYSSKNQVNVFGLEPQSTYRFYSESVDNVGNSEIKTPMAEATAGPATGVKNHLSSGSIQLYPNPTTGVLQARFVKPLNGNISYTIVTVDGRIVSQKVQQPAADFTLNISDQPKGMYFIRFEQNGKVIDTAKVILH